VNVRALDRAAPDATGTEKLAPARRLPRRRTVLLAIGLVAAVVAGGYFFHWLFVGRFVESTNNAYLRADQVAMAPRVSGYVSELYVTDNQNVAAGEPLLKIDPLRYDAAVRQTKATIQMREADVAKSEADLHLQDAMVAEAQAEADNAASNVAFAQKEFDRSASLSKQGIVSKQKIDQDENGLSQARSAKVLKDAALDAARRQITTLTAQLDQARAQLTAAQESLREAQMDLGDTVLRSPVNGRVGDRSVRVGQFVQPGTRLLSVVPTNQVYLIANFKETQIERMRVGQPAEISIDAYPNLTFKGVVESFAPGTGAQFALLPPENATGNFTKVVQRVPVRIKVMNAKSHGIDLVPGLSVEVSVNTKATAPVKQADAK
jgi:membrane fusion protein, multidrug efflux system